MATFVVPFLLSPFSLCLASAPRIEFTETSFDFGTIWQNEEVSHVFALRNTGDATLVIQPPKTTCGCAVAMPEGKEIAPGAQSSIKVTFRAGTYRDRVTKHIYVDSNDPAQPRVTLTVEAVVKAEVEIAPRGLYLGRLKVGDKIERTVDMTGVDVKTFNITKLTTDSQLVRLGKPEPLPGNRPAYRLTVTIGPLLEPGRVNAKIIVNTDLPHTPQIAIAIYGKVLGDAPQTSR
ncbi:MAG: DUF1573 domain-containing protein [Armatimonadota bacterium]